MQQPSILFFSFLLLLNTVFAQSSKDKQISISIDSLLSTTYKLNDPGITVLVARKNQIIYKNAFGSANLELKTPMKAEFLFNLGSITKQFTAVAILQLMENNKLSLQDNIQKYIPKFPSKKHIITIENLLTHTSGLKDYLQIDYKEPYMERKDFTPKELIEYFKDQPLEFEPGTKYKYSNTGYFLLGYIIEMITGKTYEKYLQDNIFNVLGLTNTYYDNPSKIFPNRTHGYKKVVDFEKADYWGATIPYAAGALISNVDDLFKWHSGLISYKLIKKETLEKAFTAFNLKNNVKINYGYGWILKNFDGLHSISHGGAITGYRTNEIYYPEQDIFIALLTNCDCAPIDELSVTISGIVLGKSLQEDVKLNETVLNKYIGRYILTTNAKRSIEITKENGMLIAQTSEKQKYPLVFQSDRKFALKNILDATCEFIIENDKVIKFVVSQNGMYEWKKIE